MSELSKYPEVTDEIVKEHGLSNIEYEKIVEKLQEFHKEQSKLLEISEKKRTPAQKKKLRQIK